MGGKHRGSVVVFLWKTAVISVEIAADFLMGIGGKAAENLRISFGS
jgi:hypothetical protein